MGIRELAYLSTDQGYVLLEHDVDDPETLILTVHDSRWNRSQVMESEEAWVEIGIGTLEVLLEKARQALGKEGR